MQDYEFHLSNFHRDEMERELPEIAVLYNDLHRELKARERAYAQALREFAEEQQRPVMAQKSEIASFIVRYKLKAKKKPEVIERARLRAEAKKAEKLKAKEEADTSSPVESAILSYLRQQE